MVIPNQACKYVVFQIVTSKTVFSNALAVITDTSYFLFALTSSNFHNEWAWKYASRMKADMRYTPTDVFETFPFSKNVANSLIKTIEDIGNKLDFQRKEIMKKYEIGLTKLYNFIHTNYEKVSIDSIKEVKKDIVELRSSLIALDNQILEAYGWADINLNHDFYEIDYLLENDCVRFTIDPTVRKEVLKRLLLLNLQQYHYESKSDTFDKNIGKKKSKIVLETPINTLFPED